MYTNILIVHEFDLIRMKSLIYSIEYDDNHYFQNIIILVPKRLDLIPSKEQKLFYGFYYMVKQEQNIKRINHIIIIKIEGIFIRNIKNTWWVSQK